jgi:hypothetical protein
MSQHFGVPYEKWRLVNVMLPRVYYPPLQVKPHLLALAPSLSSHARGPCALSCALCGCRTLCWSVVLAVWRGSS